jgi:ribosomal protein L22
MAVAKRTQRKQSGASRLPKARQDARQFEGKELRQALEELRDTKNERRAKALKKAIANSICGT